MQKYHLIYHCELPETKPIKARRSRGKLERRLTEREGVFVMIFTIRFVVNLHLCYKGFLLNCQASLIRVWTRRESNPYRKFRRFTTYHMRAHTMVHSTTPHIQLQ